MTAAAPTANEAKFSAFANLANPLGVVKTIALIVVPMPTMLHKTSFLSCSKAIRNLKAGNIFVDGLSGSRSMNANLSFESRGGAWRILKV